jgi:hypothetical protein
VRPGRAADHSPLSSAAVKSTTGLRGEIYHWITHRNLNLFKLSNFGLYASSLANAQILLKFYARGLKEA